MKKIFEQSLAGLFTLLSFVPPQQKTTVWLVGDSTMANKNVKAWPETGWGMPFASFFDSTVIIDNRAQNGSSTKSFIVEQRWQAIMDDLKEGDYVFIQFGHNDEVPTKANYTPEDQFAANLVRFIKESQSKKAIPILITPVARRKFDTSGKIEETHAVYAAIVRKVAAEQQVPLIDLDRESQELLQRIGPENSKSLFNYLPPGQHPNYPEGRQDDTHFNELGARRMAELVLNDIRRLPLGLAQHIGRGTQNYSWDHLPEVQRPAFKKDTVTITAYGARPDGITLNTRAINKAITECSRKGGGVVLVPQGLWLTGPIVLKSNVNLHIDRAAILEFTTDFDQYPIVAGNWEGHPAARCQSPLSATDQENIAITGTGIIDGNGDAWRWIAKDRLTEAEWKKKVSSGGVVTGDGKTWFPSAQSLKGYRTKEAGVLRPGQSPSSFEDIRDFLRPNLLVLTNCKRVLLDGPSFQNSPAWCLHTLLCEQLTVHDVHVRNPWYAANGDGIDIESCKNVLLENSTFDAGDDGICIKSGRDEEGRKRGAPTENVIVRNNIVYHAHGGFVIGSEMSGGARNIFVYNCSFQGTDIGLRFKTTRGRGGVVEKIYVKNISMKDIEHQAVFLDMYYFAKPAPLSETPPPAPPVTEATPQFRDIHISNVVCDGAEEGIFIRGLPEMSIKDIYLENMVLKAAKGVELTAAQHISLKNIRLITTGAGAAGKTGSGSEKMTTAASSAGSAPETVSTAASTGSAPSTAVGPIPVIYIENSSDLLFDSIQYDPGAAILFSINGDKNANIRVLHTAITKAARPAIFNYGAKELNFTIVGGSDR